MARIIIPADATESAIEIMVGASELHDTIDFAPFARYVLHRTLHLPGGRRYWGGLCSFEPAPLFEGRFLLEIDSSNYTQVEQIYCRSHPMRSGWERLREWVRVQVLRHPPTPINIVGGIIFNGDNRVDGLAFLGGQGRTVIG